MVFSTALELNFGHIYHKYYALSIININISGTIAWNAIII